MTKASPREVEEVVAFELAFLEASKAPQGPGTGPPTREQFIELWQQDKDLREQAYIATGKLVQKLEQRGVGFKAVSTPKVHKAIEDMVTIPPRTAYTLPGKAAFG